MARPSVGRTRVLEFARQYHARTGLLPTTGEVAKGCGFASRNAAQYHLTALIAAGELTAADARPGLRRAVPVADDRLPVLGRTAAGRPLDPQAEPGEWLHIHSLFPGAVAVRVEGDSMVGAQVADGDWVIVRPAEAADDGVIVLAWLRDEGLTLKKLVRRDGRVTLAAVGKRMKPLPFDEGHGDRIVGEYLGVIRRV
jgi:repressor LexA